MPVLHRLPTAVAGSGAPFDQNRSPLGLLDRQRIIADSGFNRWLMPPAALAIHLCIGMAYGFSVFWLPLTRAIGIDRSIVCEPTATLFAALISTSCDWKVSDLGWVYTLFFVFLGSSAALWGGWLERAGPRKAGVVAALCWCGGLWISAIGVAGHQLWMMWLGSGVIGGIGLGLGYISPVSMLIRWFPDHRGMATGMAIMGFGGGAMIGAPLADMLMNAFRTPVSVGVWQTFVVLGLIYLVFMLGGAFGYRLPPSGWRPPGSLPDAQARVMITPGQVHFRNAHKIPQFWLLWAVLCLNVSAGIGVIGMASPMLQEIFGGSLIGQPDVTFMNLNEDQRRAAAAVAAGFTGLLSLFNIAGRFCLGLAVGQAWPPLHLRRLLCTWRHAVCRGSVGCAPQQSSALCHLYRPHRLDVRRWIRCDPCLPRRSLRNAVCECNPRPLADRLVNRRCRRANARQLYSRGANLCRDTA
jgi:MFS family permease